MMKEASNSNYEQSRYSFITSPRSTMNTAVKPQLTIDKETFDALKRKKQDKSVYKLVYKNEGRRPAYFSFLTAIRYPEVIALIAFSIFQ